MGGSVHLNPEIKREEAYYQLLADSPWEPYMAVAGNGSFQFGAVGPEMTARQVNAVMYYSSPYKTHGLDTTFVMLHERLLYEQVDADMIARKLRHENIPGWKKYYEGGGTKARVYDLLKRGTVNGNFIRNSDPNDTIRPVLRWVKSESYENVLVFDPITPGEWEAICEGSPIKISSIDGGLDTPLGAVTLAAYAPDLVAKWPVSVNYQNGYSGDNENGPTQIIPWVIWKHRDLSSSPVLSALTEYILKEIFED
jgi:hypothetical protein